MLTPLLTFLVAILVLVVVIYVCKLVLDMIPLPAPIKQIVWLILGLIALVALIIIACRVLNVNIGI